MKKITNKLLLLAFCFLLGDMNIHAQDRHHKNEKGRSVHVNQNYKRSGNSINRGNHNTSRYRPNFRVNYRPSWAHHTSYRRRWVYFPKYNFYYDNWRQMYYYQNNAQWILNVNLPPAMININLENENHFQLNEDEDDMDEIYKYNKNHNDSSYR